MDEISPHLGRTVGGRYELKAVLGRGGFAVVYRALDKLDDVEVALKVLDTPSSLSAPAQRDFISKFQEEAKVTRRTFRGMRHVRQILDMGVAQIDGDSLPWMAMELLEGETLDEWLQRRRGSPDRIPEAEVLALVTPILDTIASAHQRGVVHRDLKPANIFLAREGDTVIPKVLDFGIAKVLQGEETASGSTMTTTTLHAFSPQYASPEQFASKKTGKYTDVFALGLILTELLADNAPLSESGDRTECMMAALDKRERPTPRARGAQVSDAVESVVARAVSLREQDRFPDAGDLLKSFASACTGDGSSAAWYPKAGRAEGTVPRERAGMPPTATPSTHEPARFEAKGLTEKTEPMVPIFGAPSSPTQQAMAAAPRRTPRTRARDGVSPKVFGIGVAAAVAMTIVVVRGMGKSEGQSSKAVETKPNKPPAAENVWVRVEPPNGPWLLGVDSDDEPANVRGFRPSRKIVAPSSAYEIQQHEVTWAEIDPWLETNTDKKFPVPSVIPSDEKARAKLPATNVPWSVAVAYCNSVGGDLPTEAQWEYAARGQPRRKLASDERFDLDRVNVFGGPQAKLAQIMTAAQDRTPGAAEVAIYDMLGNAQEWTRDIYIDDEPGHDESWAQTNRASYRAVRGLPLAQPFDAAAEPLLSLTYRVPACATGVCARAAGENAQVETRILSHVSFGKPEDDAATSDGASKRTFADALPTVQDLMSKCLPAGTLDDVGVRVTFKKGTSVRICRAGDGIMDYDEGQRNCCVDPVNGYNCGGHGVWAWVDLATPKATVRLTSPVADSGPAECVRRVIESMIVGKKVGETTAPAVKWPEKADAWTASVSIVAVRERAPANLPTIGFRCARALK